MKISKIIGSKGLHIETEGCIVNIIEGLYDQNGRSVISVEIIPDDRFMGERIWRLRGTHNNRIVELKKKLKHGKNL
jgi:hypothetical protein